MALQACSLGADPGGSYVIPSGGAPGVPLPVTYASCGALNYAADFNTANNSSSTGVGNLGDGIPLCCRTAANQQPLLKTIYNTYNTNSSIRPATGVSSRTPNDVSADTYFANNSSRLRR